MREQTERTITRLQDTMSESHKETVCVVSDFQSTSIDHAEVLRRLEQELLAFKLDTETKLTEEARKLSGVIVDQRKIGESVDLAAADSTLGRLKEVELALLKEREMRKTLEHEVVAMRGERGATQAMVEEAVHASMRTHGGGTEALEEKVKECGRMILRMGSELMEETKCRLTVEAELQELRMRLAGAEAAAARAPYSGGGA